MFTGSCLLSDLLNKHWYLVKPKVVKRNKVEEKLWTGGTKTRKDPLRQLPYPYPHFLFWALMFHGRFKFNVHVTT